MLDGEHLHNRLDGRSDATRSRADTYGLRDVGSLDSLISDADIVLCIMPPEFGPATAECSRIDDARAPPLLVAAPVRVPGKYIMKLTRV